MEPIKSSPEAEATAQHFRLLAAFLAGAVCGGIVMLMLLR